MISSLPTNDESDRLISLRATGLLDSPPEEEFDRITRLACQIMDTEIAAISLVDENRQWFKSSVGLEVRETPRNISFCGHAIHDTDLLIIPDARQDARFFDNPLVTGSPHIAFYAGAPITALDGRILGTLCSIDRRPCHPTPQQLRGLQDLARLAEQRIHFHELYGLHKLTQLSTRSGFLRQLDIEVNRARRDKLPIALMMVDIDNLKLINEKHGRGAGDETLIAVGKILKAHTQRASDHLGHLNSDNFALCFGYKSIENLEDMAASVIDLAKNQFSQRSTPTQLSLGIAAADNLDFKQDSYVLLQQAELSLHCAKQQKQPKYSLSFLN